MTLMATAVRPAIIDIITMTPSTVSDPSSQGEQVSSIQPTKLSDHVSLQPPLSRPSGSGIILFLPNHDRIGLEPVPVKPGNAEPQTKWAEGGYTVVAVTDYDGLVVGDVLKQALDALQAHEGVHVKDKYAVVGEHFPFGKNCGHSEFTIMRQYTSLDSSIPYPMPPPRNLVLLASSVMDCSRRHHFQLPHRFSILPRMPHGQRMTFRQPPQCTHI